MIACDTSSLIAYWGDESGDDVAAVEECLQQNAMVLPPVVLSEILSDPALPKALSLWLKQCPLLEPTEGYWERAGLLRARILSRGLKSRLADAFIAQICIDHGVRLITRDKDFRHYVKWGALKLL